MRLKRTMCNRGDRCGERGSDQEALHRYLLAARAAATTSCQHPSQSLRRPVPSRLART
jgi:hypothetical protein